jgi:5S rRNA maturation endonuclease (ribonuclease M5)
MPRFHHEYNSKEKLILTRVEGVLQRYQEWLPLSVRRIYYALRSEPDPVIKASKYSYQIVVRVLKKARFNADVPFEWLADGTRYADNLPLSLDRLIPNYYPDPWQNQRNYVEVVVEKEAQAEFYRRILRDYYIAVTHVRGYDSVSNAMEIAVRLNRYLNRPRHLFIHSDFDPSGENLAEKLGFTLGKCLVFLDEKYEEFNEKANIVTIPNLSVRKTVLTFDQVRELGLPTENVNKNDPRAARFIEKYGDNTAELEAIPPDIHSRMIIDPLRPLLELPEIEKTSKKHHWVVTEGLQLLQGLESSFDVQSSSHLSDSSAGK